MPALAELTTLRDALVRARLGGLREVRDANGESIQYKSDAEMAAALAAVERELAARSGTTMPKTIVFRTSKGL